MSDRARSRSSLDRRVVEALAAEGATVGGNPVLSLLQRTLDEVITAEQGEVLEESAGIGGRLHDRCAALFGLQDLHDELTVERQHRRLQAFVRVHDALARLRSMPSLEAMIARAPEAAAVACDFDRVVVYRINGPELLAESFYIRGDLEGARRLLAFSRTNPAQLREQILETEMIRRGIPMLVEDALEHPSTYKPLVKVYGTSCYCAAPIMPEGRVIGFVHADNGLKRPHDTRAMDSGDRDVLWSFAEGFGYAIERMQLLERLRAQGQEMRRLIARTDAVVAEYLDAEVKLISASQEGAAATRTASALFEGPETGVEAQLSPREREVLALVAQGATNGVIADRLFITEATAKSHMKRILRKLGVTNRVEAAAVYLRARGRDEADARR